jgi:predicted transport protein
MVVQHQKVYVYLKLDPSKLTAPQGISRDVSNIGHFGTGDLEITVGSLQDLELTKPFIRMAYEKVGG